MPRRVSKKPEESWRECTARYCRKCGFEREALAHFDRLLAAGRTPSNAALWLIIEWMGACPSRDADDPR